MKLLFENWRRYLKEQVGGSDFSQAIQSALPGDLLRVQVLIPVEKYYQTIFKPGKLYNAAVSSDGNRITIETEPLPMGFGSEQTLTKDEFIENIHEQAKELGKTPCEIVACTRSEIIRGDKRKTFTEYLKNPTFEPKREPPPEIPAEVPAQEPVEPSDAIPQGPGDAAQIVSDDDIQDIMATFQARIAQITGQPRTTTAPEDISPHGQAGLSNRGCGDSKTGYAPGVSQFGEEEGTVSWSKCALAGKTLGGQKYT